MRIVLFGIGQIYKEKKKFISVADEIVGFLDNNQSLWGKTIEGIVVYPPEKVHEIFFDQIILMSNYAQEMKVQLIRLGCSRKKIMHYQEYLEAQKAGKLEVFFPVRKENFSKKRCLVITTDLEYNGGSIAAVYGALALKEKGYESVLAAPKCDPVFMKEICGYGISLIIYRNLNHAKEQELFWLDDFQYVVVNTLQMSCCGIEIAKRRKVVLWLHEPRPHYESMTYWKDEIQEGVLQENLKVYGVSSVARDIFLMNYQLNQIKILPYGIPDKYQGEKQRENRKFTFAMIGAVSQQKGQDIFWQAIQKMGDKRNSCTFLIIGKNLQDSCGKMIETASHQYINLQLLGEVPHEEVMQLWQNIDVLVVPSREDTLSIVATEALMLGKVCIVSEAVGISKYIHDCVDGFIIPTEDADQLADRMLWCMDHEDMLAEIGKKGRKIYESSFSMEVFGNHLEDAIRGMSKIEKEA